MDIMNFDKALNILGLERNYTEEDLKKAYRKLITKYHPDKWEEKNKIEKTKAEEKTKEINAAKDFLEKHKRKSTNINPTSKNKKHYNQSAYDQLAFIRAKASFVKELNNYDNELTTLIEENEITLLKAIKILKILNYNYRSKITNIKNIIELNKEIIEYRSKICKALEEFTAEYCNKHNIIIETTKLEKYSLKKLYEDLENIKKTQNKNNDINILDSVEEEYTSYAGYQIIKEKISEIKKQILIEYKDGLCNEDKAKRKFKTKILLELKEYFNKLKTKEEPKYKLKKNI